MKEPEIRKILFYGDSNTYGFDPRDGGRYPTDVRWPDRLAAAMREQAAFDAAANPAEEMEAYRLQILADGMNGRRVPDLNSPAAALYVDRMLRDAMPLDWFAVMLGTNDLWWPMIPDADVPASAMKKLLEHVRSHCGCRIILIAPPHLLENAKVREESRRLAELYRKMAEENEYVFADAEVWGIDLSFDRVHFSEEGHRQFAAEMKKVLLSVL